MSSIGDVLMLCYRCPNAVCYISCVTDVLRLCVGDVLMLVTDFLMLCYRCSNAVLHMF